MLLGISKQGYKEKPNGKKGDYGKMRFRDTDIDIFTLHTLIKQGHTIQSPMGISGEYGLKGLEKNNSFYSINIVSVDVDNVNCTWNELQDIISNIQPSICYETFNNGVEGKGYRYRLFYCFDKPITSVETYKSVYAYIVNKLNSNGLNISDNCAESPVQMMHGTHSYAKSKIYSSTPLTLDDYTHGSTKVSNTIINKQSHTIIADGTFVDRVPDSEWKEVSHMDDEGNIYYTDGTVDLLCKHQGSTFVSNAINNNILYNSTSHTIIGNETFVDQIDRFMLRDAEEMPIDDFMKRYWHSYPLINQVEDSEWIDGKWQYISDRYFKLCYMPKRIKDGEQRRRKLHTRAVLRKVIKPTITMNESFYNLMYDMARFIDNDSDDTIEVKELVYICEQVAKLDADQLEKDYSGLIKKLQRKNPKCGIILNRALYIHSNYAHEKSLITKDIAMQIYDPNLSINQNLENIAANGFKISKRTLMRYLGGNGNREAKNRQIEALIDPNLSAGANLKLLKAQGINVNWNKLKKIIGGLKDEKD